MEQRKKSAIINIAGADRKLKEICMDGLKEKFGENPPKAARERLQNELDIIARNEHSSYYLIACGLAKEAKRLKHITVFRGVITSSLVSYTSGISMVNPMGKEYGGVDIPFEITREEFEGHLPELELVCTPLFIFWAQSFLCREYSEYRYVSYPANCRGEGVKSIRLYMMEKEYLPSEETTEIEDFKQGLYPDYMYLGDYFHLDMIADQSLELARHNMFYEENYKFDVMDADKVTSKLWKYVKKYDESMYGFKSLKVRTYDELITVSGMAHSSEVWGGIAKKMVLEGELSLSNMIGTRDDLFLHLIRIGMDRKDAFLLTERVRKGKQLTEEEIASLKEHGAEEWVIDLCNRVRYLFPKGHIVQMLRRDVFRLSEPSVIDKFKRK